MKIIVCTVARNEEFILPYFINHYRKIVDKVVIFDNKSTDSTAAVAKELGAEVIPFEGDSIYARTDLQGLMLKQYSDYDWVIIVDADEFMVTSREQLQDLFDKAYNGIRAEGYNMYGEAKPAAGVDIVENITTGIADAQYNKFCAFVPSRITEFRAGIGMHYCRVNPANYAKEKVKLLHFKFMGSLVEVQAMYANKINKGSKDFYFQLTEAKIAEQYNKLKKNSKAI